MSRYRGSAVSIRYASLPTVSITRIWKECCSRSPASRPLTCAWSCASVVTAGTSSGSLRLGTKESLQLLASVNTSTALHRNILREPRMANTRALAFVWVAMSVAQVDGEEEGARRGIWREVDEPADLLASEVA